MADTVIRIGCNLEINLEIIGVFKMLSSPFVKMIHPSIYLDLLSFLWKTFCSLQCRGLARFPLYLLLDTWGFSVLLLVGWKMVPQRCQVLIPKTCKCDLIWKKVFIDVIRWRILRWGDCSGLSGWTRKAITGIIIWEAEGGLTRHTEEEVTGRWDWERSEDAGREDGSDVTTCLKMPMASSSWKRWGQLLF